MTQTTPGASLRAFDQLAAAKRQGRGTPIPQVPLAQIAPMPGQPRQSFDPEALAELAESIKTHGVIQPIILIARRNADPTDAVRYSIVCGERRYQAAQSAGLTAIPALVRDYDDDEAAVLALLENLQREDLTPLEEGEYLAKLKQKYGFTEEQLGERLGKSRDYVHMRTRLTKLSPDILEAWKASASTAIFDALTPSHAILVNQLQDETLRRALTQACLGDGITVAEVRRRLELVKEAEAAGLGDEATDKLRESAVKGISHSEFAMRLAGYKKRMAPPQAPSGDDPRLAVQDLAVVELVEKLVQEGAREVALSELALALKKDMAWVRKLKREGLGG